MEDSHEIAIERGETRVSASLPSMAFPKQWVYWEVVLMDEIIKRIEKEIKTYSFVPKDRSSRWRIGYVDGLKKALKIIEEERK